MSLRRSIRANEEVTRKTTRHGRRAGDGELEFVCVLRRRAATAHADDPEGRRANSEKEEQAPVSYRWLTRSGSRDKQHVVIVQSMRSSLDKVFQAATLTECV